MDKNNYIFLGYSLIEAILNRSNNKMPQKVNIKTINSKIDDTKLTFEMNVKLVFTFNGDNKIELVFDAIFKLPDSKVKEELGKYGLTLESVLFPIVYPFIRTQIYSMTNDS